MYFGVYWAYLVPCLGWEGLVYARIGTWVVGESVVGAVSLHPGSMGSVGDCGRDLVIFYLFHEFGDTLVETIVCHEPSTTMGTVAYGKFLLGTDEGGRLHHFGGCRIAETARGKDGVVGLFGVDGFVEIATECDTINRVVLSYACIGVIAILHSRFKISLNATSIARNEDPIIVAHKSTNSTITLGPSLHIADIGTTNQATIGFDRTNQSARIKFLVGFVFRFFLPNDSFHIDRAKQAVTFVGHDASAIYFNHIGEDEVFDHGI